MSGGIADLFAGGCRGLEELEVGESLLFWVPLRGTSRGCLLWVVYSVVTGSPPRGINS